MNIIGSMTLVLATVSMPVPTNASDADEKISSSIRSIDLETIESVIVTHYEQKWRSRSAMSHIGVVTGLVFWLD